MEHLLRIITTNKTINDSRKVTKLEKVTPNGYMYLGTYTFLIIDSIFNNGSHRCISSSCKEFKCKSSC